MEYIRQVLSNVCWVAINGFLCQAFLTSLFHSKNPQLMHRRPHLSCPIIWCSFIVFFFVENFTCYLLFHFLSLFTLFSYSAFLPLSLSVPLSVVSICLFPEENYIDYHMPQGIIEIRILSILLMMLLLLLLLLFLLLLLLLLLPLWKKS